MPIYIKANLTCNFSCAYCYEHPIRPEDQNVDFAAVEKTVRELYKERYGDKKDEKGGARIGLHGGEALFMTKENIEGFLKLSHELSGRSSIQTNAYLIDDDIIEMFKKYKTGVGISIDGPWPCNELRGIGTKEERKKQTEIVLRNIDRLQKEGINVSIIAVIHKKNALGDRREIMKNWIVELNNRKISGRFNPCCCDNKDIDLTPEEAADFYSDMFYFLLRNGISGWSPWKDMTNSLLRRESVVCVFKECDPYHTPSCIPVFEDGSYGVCLRIYSDGKTYLRSNRKTNLRTTVLSQTDCKDCPWWTNCYGGCLGLGKDFDWRNKDRFCLMYKTIFGNIANALKALRIEPKKTESGQPKKRTRPRVGGHPDGFTYTDGDTRYTDSDMKFLWEDDPQRDDDHLDHQDGIEHLDGGRRYLDSG